MELFGSLSNISGSVSASVFTGSYIGDGAGLYNLPASGVTGLNLSQISTGSISASLSPEGFNVNTDTSITGSLIVSGDTQINGTQTISGSILPSVDNEYDLGSPSFQWRDVYISSGSLYIDGTKVISSTTQELTITTDEGQSIKILEAGSDSIVIQTADGDIELKSSGGGDVLLDPTNGIISIKGTTQIQDGFKITSSGGTNVVFGNDVVVSGSINLTGTIDGVDLDQFKSDMDSMTGSNDDRLDSLETTSGSHNTRIGDLESFETTVNAGLEFTGSNVTIKGDLLVKGTETRVNSTTVEISDNIISLNGSGAANAGIEVRDATSPGLLSGSLIWDGTNNYWKGGTKSSEQRLLTVLDTGSLVDRLDSIEGVTGSYITGYTETDTLDSVTDRGSTTTNDISVGNITATSFVKTSGLSSQFLKADGSVSTNPGWITGYTETDTLATVTSRGNTTTTSIGIGVSTPSSTEALVIHKDDTNGQYVTHRNNTGFFLNRTYADYNNDGTTVEYQERVGVDGNYTRIGNFSDHPFYLMANNDTKVSILTNGNVGIGLTDPTAKLHLFKSENSSDDVFKIQSNYYDLFGFLLGTYTDFIINSSGNVGINTDSPAYKLDVNGSLHASSITIANNIIHEGDTNTYVGFGGADYFRVVTGGSSRLEVTNTSVSVTLPLYVSNIIGHLGDTNTYMSFPSNDNISWYTNGSEKMALTGAGDLTVTGTFSASGYNKSNWDTAYSWGNHASAGYATLSGSNSFSNSYNEFGNGVGSVSNDGSWNGRVNVAGSQHARLDVTSVSDGIITTMFSHTGNGAGKVGTMSNHPIDFMINGTSRVRVDTSGHLVPLANATQNLGSSSLAWANIYTNDLHLSNMNKEVGNEIDGTKGDWTIQEGQENLYIINNNNGKKYRINLVEI